MCGICGIATASAGDLATRIWRAVEAIQHRGPDRQDVFIDEGIAFGHARLSIVDLSESGNQPMRCMTSGRVIVFNGEIYNFGSLRRELVRLGYQFQSNSDTEVILHSLSEWGMDAFEKLNGIFAFAVWNPADQTLLLCRDRFGVKPLYYHFDGKELVFGSEIKAILSSTQFKRTVSLASLHEFAYYGVSLGSQTLIDGIQEVAPGSWLQLSSNELTTGVFWSIGASHQAARESVSAEQALTQTRKALEDAVACQLTGDVPIGVFLSGGLDSSCITAFASKHYGGRLDTFSVGFDFHVVNELPLARRVADFFGTNHHELHVKGASLPETIEKLVTCHDAPFSDAANIPLYLLCQELSGDIKVVLQGDGGDEVFGGYRRYSSVAQEKKLRMLAWLSGLPFMSELLPSRFQRYVECFQPQDRGERMARLLTMERVSPPPIRVFHEELQFELNKYDPFSRYRQLSREFEHLDPIQAMLLVDMQIVLPDVFLEKVDKSTMAHGIEVRVPMLENSLVEYVCSLPSQIKTPRGRTKWLLRQALKGVLPEFVLEAPKKGFGVPFSNWLRGPLAGYAQDVMFSDEIQRLDVFQVETLRALFDQHLKKEHDHGFILWKMLNLAIWLRQYKPLIVHG